MRLSLREVDPRGSSARLLSALQREFEGWGDPAKFDWLYLDNPEGPARTWVLEDEAGELVGVSSAFPRRLRSDSRTLRAWVLGDFCVDKAHRSLGPAIQLQRAILESIRRGEVDLCYDFPSRVMASVYRRMGVRSFRRLDRYVRPLTLDPWVERKVGSGAVARGLAAVGNTVLRVQDKRFARDEALAVRLWEGPLDARFEALPSVLEGGVRVERTVAYLDWRYGKDPLRSNEIRVAERGGALIGFAVTRRGNSDLAVVDACGTGAVVRELVLEALASGRAEGLATVSIGLSQGHPLTEVVTELGFQRRDDVPYIVYAGAEVSEEAAAWYLMNGDRDV